MDAALTREGNAMAKSRIKVKVRKGMPSVAIDRAEFAKRYRALFYDPAFEKLQPEMNKIIAAAWDAYDAYRKSPRTRPAGTGFADPAYELPLEWLATRAAIEQAAKRHQDAKSPARILLVNGSSRSDQTCPGEMSKTYRLAMLAKNAIDKTAGFE